MHDALVIIDMQNWMFRTPERQDQLPAIVDKATRLVAAYRAAGRPIFDVHTLHKADRSTWSRLMLAHDYACLIEGTADAAHVPDYDPGDGAISVAKTRNSAFLGTNLDCLIATNRIERLVLAGVFIDGCVGLTAADAAQRDLEVALVEDAIGHTDARFRAPMLDWLVDCYELERTTTAAVVSAVRD